MSWPYRRVVDKPRHDRGGLHHVCRLHSIIDIHVGVVRARAVLHRILQEAESGQADPRK